MTEDSQSRMRSGGPFPEDAEPTEQIATPESTNDDAVNWITEPARAASWDQYGLAASSDQYGLAASSDQYGLAASPDQYGPAASPDQYGPAASPDQYGPAASSDPYAHRGNAATPATTSDPYGLVAPPGRRIEPSPPPQRSRLLTGVLAGLAAGLLIFGTVGYVIGRATAPRLTWSTPGAAARTRSGGLGVFEQNQVAINRPAFAGTGLAALSEGWLPYVATCTRNGRPGGPALNAGEKNRVRCTLDGMSAIFVEYNSIADRDKARARALAQALDARSLTPGVGAAAELATPSGRTNGSYVEYAYRLTERGTTRTISGIWWDDAPTPVAGYLLAYWKEGAGESWAPIRDLWSRYA